MKYQNIMHRFAASAAGLGLALGLFSPQPAQAIDFEPLSVPVCFGFGIGSVTAAGGGLSGVEEIDGTAGWEFLEINRTTDYALDSADGNVNGLATLDQEVRIKARDEDGSLLWNRKLSLGSQEIFSTLAINPSIPELAIGVLFDSTGTFNVFYAPTPVVCSNVAVLDAGGNKVVAVVVGTSAASGDLTGGTDYTQINVWILNATTGAPIATHKIRARGSRFFLASQSYFGDNDGDGDDELVTAYTTVAAPVGDEQTFETLFFSFDLLTTQEESRVKITPKTKFTNPNAP